MALAEVLSKTGYLKLMEEAVQNMFPNERYSLAALPALIGLIPMPAGALVSVPMIEEVRKRRSSHRRGKRSQTTGSGTYERTHGLCTGQ